MNSELKIQPRDFPFTGPGPVPGRSLPLRAFVCYTPRDKTSEFLGLFHFDTGQRLNFAT
jgi:hypothetical protein